MALTDAALSGIDAQSAVRIFLSILHQLSRETQAHLLELWAKRDAELAGLLLETSTHIERDRALIDLRRQTRSPRQRMLLALVLNLPDRRSIDAVLREIAPHEPPEDWLWNTIRSNHDTPDRQPGDKGLFGFSLNEVSEEVLKMLLRGHSVDEVSKTVAGYDELADDVRRLCSTLSALPVLGPLLERRPEVKAGL
jgi:hypothetical protein